MSKDKNQADSVDMSNLQIIRMFSGENINYSIQNFLDDVEGTAKISGWSDEHQIFAIKHRLTGEAERFFRESVTLREANLATIRKVLKERFSPDKDKAQLLNQFLRCVQDEGETVIQFASKLENLAYLCVSDSVTRQEFLMTRFIEGLKDEIRPRVKTHCPKSFDAAKQQAIIEERIVQQDLLQELKVCDNGELQELRKLVETKDAELNQTKLELQQTQIKLQEVTNRHEIQIKELTQKIADLKKEVPGTSRPRFEQVQCYRCGRNGHTSRVCRTTLPKQGNNFKTFANNSSSSGNSSRSQDQIRVVENVESENVKMVAREIPLIKVLMQQQVLLALVDTGAQVSIISEKVVKNLKGVKVRKSDKLLKGLSEKPVVIQKELESEFKIGSKTCSGIFCVSPISVSDKYSIILGVDFLTKYGCIIKCDQNSFSLQFTNNNFSREHRKFNKNNDNSKCLINYVYVPEQVCIPANSFQLVKVKVENPDLLVMPNLLVSPNGGKLVNCVMARSVVSKCENNEYWVSVLNVDDISRTIKKNTIIGSIGNVSLCNVVENVDSDPEPWDYLDWGSPVDLEHLSGDVKTQVQSLLKKHNKLFAKKLSDLPGCYTYPFQISLIDNEVCKQAPYKVPYKLKEELNTQIKELLTSGIIEESTSPYAAPVLLVRKADGSYRLCCDYRKLNKKTEAFSYPMPTIQSLLDKLQGARYFSTLDLMSGFHQQVIEPESRKYTAFRTENNLYQFTRTPFGLKNSPTSFTKLMNIVLSQLDQNLNIVCYVDDLVIGSKTISEHLEKLGKLFEVLEHHNLRLKGKKCKILHKEISYLGFQISDGKIQPDPARTAAIKDLLPPNSKRKVRSFLGVVGFYRKFVPNFAEIAIPLFDLIKGKNKFIWTGQCQMTFEKLKEAILSGPSLYLPDLNRDFSVHTDASGQALGAVLSQINDEGIDYPVAFASRRLQDPETRYSTVEREVLAIVYALQQFRTYIYGKRINVYTDQSSLQYILNLRDPSSRICRWSLLLQEYDCNIVHKPGSLNIVADYLSRPVKGVRESKPVVTQTRCSSQKSIAELQSEDIFCKEIFEKLADKEYVWWKLRRYFCENGILKCNRRGSNSSVVVLPLSLVNAVLEERHDSNLAAHKGVGATKFRVLQDFYRPGLNDAIENWVSSCKICIARKGHRYKKKTELKSYDKPTRPFQIVQIDAVGPLPITTRGNKYILVLTDYFTRWSEAFAVSDLSTKTVAGVLEKVICQHGLIEYLVSDQGSSFVSKAAHKVYGNLGIKKLTSTSYHPETNGLVERLNGTLINSLAMLTHLDHSRWDQFIDSALFAHRTTINATTGYSPYYLIYGRQPVLPLNLLTPLKESVNVNDFVQDLDYRMQAAYKKTLENTEQSSEKMIKRFNTKAKIPEFQKGDNVFLYTPVLGPNRNRKLNSYNTGPWKILDIIGPVNVLIKNLKNNKIQRVHVNRIRKIQEREERPEARFEEQNLPTDLQDEETEFQPWKKIYVKEKGGKSTELERRVDSPEMRRESVGTGAGNAPVASPFRYNSRYQLRPKIHRKGCVECKSK